MGLLAPAFLAGLLAVGVPVLVHMIHRERRETVAFPSLMFLRKIPYRSVRRQKLRHLLLLALRCLAIAIVVAAFARPFLEKKVLQSAASANGREVVLLLDRSYSMANGGRWARAQDAVKTIASQIGAADRISLVTFGTTASQIVSPTSDGARIVRAASSLRPTSDPTRLASGLRLAAQVLAASELARREVIVVSDFHRFGWTPSDEVIMPPQAAVRTVDVSRHEGADIAVASVAIARNRVNDRVRATVTARAINLGGDPRTVDATLEIAGRGIDTRRITVPAHGTAQAVFASTPVTQTAARGIVRISNDSQPSNDRFFFTVSEAAGASALIVEPAGARGNQSLFINRAWSVADDPPVRVTVKSSSDVKPADVNDRSIIVLNEAELPAGAVAAALRARVRAGATLLVVPGDRSLGTTLSEWRNALPAIPGAATDRADGRWASVDFSHPLFEPFRAARADFSSVRVSHYRVLTPSAGDSAQVIARLDDGSPLLVERSFGSGRVLMWASSLDASANDLPFHPLFVPLMHQLGRTSLASSEARSWFTAPYVLDLSGQGNVIVESPSGERTRFAADSTRAHVELRERGFYEVRAGGTAIGAGHPIAVNVDLAESDLSHMDPKEVVASLATRGVNDASHAPAFDGTAQEMERRQAIWWYLLMGALLVLGAETLLSNRLSRRFEQEIRTREAA